jgi:hypothetical protein
MNQNTHINMNEYIVTFEQGGEQRTVIVNAETPQNAKFNVMNANGKIDYFNSILLNDTEEE